MSGNREFYTVFAKGLHLAIDSRYQHLVPTGSGSYGIVCSAIDSVAIFGLKMTYRLRTCEQLSRYLQSTRNLKSMNFDILYDSLLVFELQRELKYLRFFNECPQTLHVLDYYCYPYSSCVRINSYKKRIRCLYMVTPFYDYDLEMIIDAQNVHFPPLIHYQYMTIDQIRLLLYQLLLSLRYIHSAGVSFTDSFDLVHASRCETG